MEVKVTINQEIKIMEFQKEFIEGDFVFFRRTELEASILTGAVAIEMYTCF